MSVLSTENLCKKYKDIMVVDHVNMHIEEGDIYGFVGENGAGKTTVIRLITGLSNVTDGRFSLFGVSSDDKKICNARNKVCGIAETVSIVRNMTALENLRFQCYVTDNKKTDEELIGLIKKVGLNYDDIKKKKAGNFSLGMRQRLGIALTMVSDPKFVILDEPMNGLDPEGFVEVRETILKLNQEGVTFLISSHILSELEKICTKVGFISRGKLIEEMSIDDLHNRSRSRIAIRAVDNNTLFKLLADNFEGREIESKNGEVVIYDTSAVNQIIDLLSQNRIEIKSINVTEGTIEDYYIDLMKGGRIS